MRIIDTILVLLFNTNIVLLSIMSTESTESVVNADTITTATSTPPSNTSVTYATSSSTPNMAETQIRYNPISLPRLSGILPTPKGEVSFRVWNYQLQALKEEEHLSENQLKQTIRRSLVGDAAESLMSLPSNASSDAIIQYVQDNYGTDTITIDGWKAFHSACQKPGESITNWKMRLENLYRCADPEGNFLGHQDQLMITAFWTNMSNKDLRIATSVERQNARKFGLFFRYVKTQEPLYVHSDKSVKPLKSLNVEDELISLRREMKELKIKNESLEKQVEQHKTKWIPTCHACGKKGHIKPNCYKSNIRGQDKGAMALPQKQ